MAGGPRAATPPAGPWPDRLAGLYVVVGQHPPLVHRHLNAAALQWAAARASLCERRAGLSPGAPLFCVPAAHRGGVAWATGTPEVAPPVSFFSVLAFRYSQYFALA